MNKAEIIPSLNIIASDLDKNGSYRLAEKIDNTIIKIAILSDEGAKSLIGPHPGKKYIRRNLGLPPENIFESMQLKIEDLVGKLTGKRNKKKYALTSKFIESIFQQYQETGWVNSAFVDFLVQSASFAEQVYRIIQNRPEQQDTWKKLFEDIKITISKNLSLEARKLDNVNIKDSWNKTQFYSALQSLSLLQDYLPTELISEIKAYQEFLSGRKELEQHVQTISKIGDPFIRNEEEAQKELKDYTTPTDEELENLQKTTISKMNKRQIIASLNNIANTLDSNYLYNEANIITEVMKKLSKKHEDDDSIDEEMCPRCEGDDIESDKNGKPTKCYNCGWPEEEDEDKDNEEPR